VRIVGIFFVRNWPSGTYTVISNTRKAVWQIQREVRGGQGRNEGEERGGDRQSLANLIYYNVVKPK